MFDGGHAESFPKVVGDKRRVSSGFRQLSFVERKKDYIAEIKVTGFQYSHDLHANGRFSMERNVGSGQNFADQAS